MEVLRVFVQEASAVSRLWIKRNKHRANFRFCLSRGDFAGAPANIAKEVGQHLATQETEVNDTNFVIGLVKDFRWLVVLAEKSRYGEPSVLLRVVLELRFVHREDSFWHQSQVQKRQPMLTTNFYSSWPSLLQGLRFQHHRWVRQAKSFSSIQHR